MLLYVVLLCVVTVSKNTKNRIFVPNLPYSKGGFCLFRHIFKTCMILCTKFLHKSLHKNMHIKKYAPKRGISSYQGFETV